MKDKLIWPLIIVLVIGIGILVLRPELLPGKTGQQTVNVSQQDYGRLAAQVSELTRQQNQIKDEYAQKIKGAGTLALLFTEYGTQFMEELAPLMEAVNLPGMLAFTEMKYPGAEGCLTQAQWQTLYEKGWRHCLYWDGTKTLDAWLTEAQAALTKAGLPASDILYFAPEAYAEEHLPVLQKHGIATAICYPAATADYLLEVADDQVWTIGALSWCSSNASAFSSSVTSEGGSIVLAVHDECQLNAEYVQVFQSMMEALSSWQQAGTVYITDVAEAKAFRQGVQNGRSALEAERAEKLAEIQAQIDAVNQQMTDLLQK